MPIGSARVSQFGVLPDAVPENGLEHRYKAEDLALSDGNSVSTFTDITGTADLSATGSPTYRTGIINGKPVVRYDGADDFHQGTFTTISQPNETFLVAAARSTATGNNEVLLDGGSRLEQSLYQTGSGDWTWRSGTANTDGTADTSFHLYDLQWDGASSVYRIDGTQIGTGDAGTNNLTGLTLGAFAASAFSYGPYDIAEVFNYSNALSTSERGSLESYVETEYGITMG